MILKDKLVKLLDDRFDLIYTNKHQGEVESAADEIIELFMDAIRNLKFRVGNPILHETKSSIVAE